MGSLHRLVTLLLLGALVAGGVVGELLRHTVAPEALDGWLGAFDFIGATLFIGLLKMVLVPLIFSSVLCGVGSLDPAHLGRVGSATLGYYLATMLIAAILGVVLVSAVRPGDAMDTSFRDAQLAAWEGGATQTQQQAIAAGDQGLWGAAQNLFSQIIPTNPIQAAADGQMLPVISFALFLGVAVSLIGSKGKPLLAISDAVFAAIMKLVAGIMMLAPLGVFCLTTATAARIGAGTLVGPLGLYALCVVVGLLIHGAIVLPLLLWLLGRTSPWRYFLAMRPALAMAFATSSSSATLPVTMHSAQTRGGVSRRASEFVLPLGSTVNMDGTALYEAVAVVFLFQCFGIDLGLVELAIVVLTATFAAIGAAGVPSIGLVTMVLVVQAVNGSLGAEVLPVAATGIVLGIDRILDMCRTTVNVWGDAVGARIITPLASDDGSPVANDPAGEAALTDSEALPESSLATAWQSGGEA